ncbi:MAG: hypothetical protein AABX28_03355 [Nanoarchaeota archaeon]
MENPINIKDISQEVLFLLVSLTGLILSEIYSLQISLWITTIFSVIAGTILIIGEIHKVNFIIKYHNKK